MIVGQGDIASVLPNKKGWIFFASGVSNSSEKRESEYQREIEGYYIPVTSPEEFMNQLKKLQSSPAMYSEYSQRCLDKSEVYRVDNILLNCIKRWISLA